MACALKISGEYGIPFVLRSPCLLENLQWSDCLLSMPRSSFPQGFHNWDASSLLPLWFRGTDFFPVPKVEASGRDLLADGVPYIQCGLMGSCSKLAESAWRRDLNFIIVYMSLSPKHHKETLCFWEVICWVVTQKIHPSLKPSKVGATGDTFSSHCCWQYESCYL